MLPRQLRHWAWECGTKIEIVLDSLRFAKNYLVVLQLYAASSHIRDILYFTKYFESPTYRIMKFLESLLSKVCLSR